MFTTENLHRSLAKLGVERFDDIFHRLKSAYTEAGRYYHTDKHVSECLTHFETIRDNADRPVEIEIALWFHDAVYDTLKNDNEERSAEWAVDYLSSNEVETDSISRIESLIIATKTHKTYDNDSEMLIDIDLGILGAPDNAFELYDKAIRQEYNWVPEEQYADGRVQVLKSFLDRDSIYQTEMFKMHYENQARNNLARKIRELNS